MSASSHAAPRVGVFTTDADLVVKTWDPTLAQMTGIPTARAEGQPLETLIPDVTARVAADVLREPLTSGSIRVLAPALHRYLIPCRPTEPSTEFAHMRQRVAIGALRNDEQRIVGLMFTVEDVTPRVERERQLARTLRAGTPVDRAAAVRELAALEEPGDLGPLHAALSDDDWQVRRTAVRALSTGQPATLVDAVVTALRDGHRNFSLLSSALELLSVTGIDVTDALISLIDHPDPDLRIQAALALGTQAGEQAAHALVSALDDPDINVRFHAIEAIGQRAYPEATSRLADIATSGEFFLAFPAIEALVRIGDPLVLPRLSPLLTAPLLSEAAAQAFGQIGDEDAIVPLVHALAVPQVDVAPILSALVAIASRYDALFRASSVIEALVNGSMTPQATSRIVRELPSFSGDSLKGAVRVLSWIANDVVPAALAAQLGSDAARQEVIEALVRCGGAAVAHLLSALAVEDPDTRRAAVVALGRMGDPRATPALAAILLDSEQRDLWVAVAGALARLGDNRAFEPLLERLGDPDAAVRHAVIGGLNSIAHPAMSARIARMLDHESALVRESAIRVAGYFGYAECAHAVFGLCRDAEEAVRTAALEHLPYFDDPRALEALRSALAGGSGSERAAAVRALAWMPGAAERDLLVQTLSDHDPWVRYFAAMALGRHGHVSALSALAARARTDPAVHVSIAAIEAVAAIGTEQAALLLSDLAGDEGPRGQASLRALGGLSSAVGLDVLRRTLRSPDPTRRSIAAESLAADGSEAAVEALSWTAAADGDPKVTRAAMAGLLTVANRESAFSALAVRALIDALAESSRREDAFAALAQLEGPALALVGEAMTVAAPPVRRTLADALGRVSHPSATARLRLALGDDDPQVRRTAIMTLSRVGAPGLTVRLTSMAKTDPSLAVQQAARAALDRARVVPSPGTE